jgi:hypothetical protein
MKVISTNSALLRVNINEFLGTNFLASANAPSTASLSLSDLTDDEKNTYKTLIDQSIFKIDQMIKTVDKMSVLQDSWWQWIGYSTQHFTKNAFINTRNLLRESLGYIDDSISGDVHQTCAGGGDCYLEKAAYKLNGAAIQLLSAKSNLENFHIGKKLSKDDEKKYTELIDSIDKIIGSTNNNDDKEPTIGGISKKLSEAAVQKEAANN